jgi:hypothetical protein
MAWNIRTAVSLVEPLFAVSPLCQLTEAKASMDRSASVLNSYNGPQWPRHRNMSPSTDNVHINVNQNTILHFRRHSGIHNPLFSIYFGRGNVQRCLVVTFCTMIIVLENSTFPNGILEYAAILTILQNKITYAIYNPTFMPHGKLRIFCHPIKKGQSSPTIPVQIHSIWVKRLQSSKPTPIWTQPLWLNF